MMVLFLINPFFFFLKNLKNFHSTKFVSVIYYVGIFFCLTFVISNDSSDADSYRNYLLEYHELSVSVFDFSQTIYDKHTDPLMPLITFLTSRITNNYHILFLVFGFFYVFFYSKFYKFSIQNFNVRQYKYFFILILFIIPIWQINGFRMWTATYAMIYSIILMNKNKNIISIFFMIFASFMHIALVPFLILIPFIKYIKFINFKILLIIFFLTLILDQFDVLSFVDFNILPKSINKSIDIYSNEDYIEELKEAKNNTNFYVKYKTQILFYPFLAITFFLSFKNLKHLNKNLPKIFILVLSLINLILSVNLGAIERFYYISNLFMGFFIFFNITNFYSSYSMQLLLKTLAITYVIIEFRFGLDYIPIDFFISNPLLAIFFNSEISLSFFINLFR